VEGSYTFTEQALVGSNIWCYIIFVSMYIGWEKISYELTITLITNRSIN